MHLKSYLSNNLFIKQFNAFNFTLFCLIFFSKDKKKYIYKSRRSSKDFKADKRGHLETVLRMIGIISGLSNTNPLHSEVQLMGKCQGCSHAVNSVYRGKVALGGTSARKRKPSTGGEIRLRVATTPLEHSNPLSLCDLGTYFATHMRDVVSSKRDTHEPPCPYCVKNTRTSAFSTSPMLLGLGCFFIKLKFKSLPAIVIFQNKPAKLSGWLTAVYPVLSIKLSAGLHKSRSCKVA